VDAWPSWIDARRHSSIHASSYICHSLMQEMSYSGAISSDIGAVTAFTVCVGDTTRQRPYYENATHQLQSMAKTKKNN